MKNAKFKAVKPIAEYLTFGILFIISVAAVVLQVTTIDIEFNFKTETEMLVLLFISAASLYMIINASNEKKREHLAERLDGILQNLKINFGNQNWLMERRDIFDLRDKLDKRGQPREIRAFGKTLRGLLNAHAGLFGELIEGGVTLQFAVLDPTHAQALASSTRWSSTDDLGASLDESIRILQKLQEKAENRGYTDLVEFKQLDQIPDGSIVGVDVDKPHGFIYYQVEIPGCPVDRLPIIYLESGSTFFESMRKGLDTIWDSKSASPC